MHSITVATVKFLCNTHKNWCLQLGLSLGSNFYIKLMSTVTTISSYCLELIQRDLEGLRAL